MMIEFNGLEFPIQKELTNNPWLPLAYLCALGSGNSTYNINSMLNHVEDSQENAECHSTETSKRTHSARTHIQVFVQPIRQARYPIVTGHEQGASLDTAKD
ncbi:hypothetical protein SUGI_0740080 [Cryptomeria japonica]|nr:hypothetical protein SUGI_0740080 [Cryptomeria japonica]